MALCGLRKKLLLRWQTKSWFREAAVSGQDLIDEEEYALIKNLKVGMWRPPNYH